MAGRRVIAVADGRTVCDNLTVADQFWPRFVGLQFRRSFEPGEGLWLTPCSSIHTCFLRFGIDLVWLDADCRVVDLAPNILPWRIAFPARPAVSVLELPAGTAVVTIGEQLAICER